MSAEAIRWACEADCPSAYAKLVLITLACHSIDGECTPSQAVIARGCKLPRETVNRQIKALADASLIRVEQRLNGIGKLPNRYFLLCDAGSHGSDVTSHGVVTQRHIPIETVLSTLKEEEEGSAVATLLLRPDDPVQDLWDRGLAILGQRQRALLGRMRKNHGDEAVLAAIIACETEHPSEPASFFIACCARSPPARHGHDKDSAVTKLYRGGMRAADKLDREEADRCAGRAVTLPLLDG